MAIDRGFSRRVDTSSLEGINRASRPRTQTAAGYTPSGMPLRQLTEPSVEQKTMLGIQDVGAGRDTVFSDWVLGNLPDGKYTKEAQPETYGYPTTPVYSSTGGGGNAALSQAFRDYIAGIQSGATDWSSAQDELTKRFAKYQQQLADVGASASQRQEASAARAAEALAAIDPQAAFQYNVTPMSISAGAGADYLRRIGASTGDVDAVRQFEQTMLNQMLGGAQQYSQATQRALDIERAARQAAVPQMLQEAQSALTSQQMAAQLGLSEAERRGLEDLLMRRSGEEQSIADRILEARLAAAEAGVTL